MILLLLLLLAMSGRCRADDDCPGKCVPDFENAAFGRTASACDASGLCRPAPDLTDLHDTRRATCWAPPPGVPLNATLHLGKKFELTYVSLQFCGPLPDGGAALQLHKSADGGRTWAPFHAWSPRCRRVPSALCRAAASNVDRLAFHALEGLGSGDLEASPVLQDWVTATDIRVWSAAPLPALADLAVGGRCKCNGHARRCSTDSQGALRCECLHGTAGPDCERCKPFHFDRPWGRAEQCVPCRCHSHSRRCRFSVELFRSSGGESGGVCQGCRHHTAGRHCQHCATGYYRDPRRSDVRHRRACKACDCHPVGSSGTACDQGSGQCPCKEGVAGLTCNRCARGYHQSRSTVAPCIRLFRSEPSDVGDFGTGDCGRCPAAKKRLNLKKYCRKDYAIQADIVSRESVGDWIRFAVHVRHVFKAGPVHLRTGPQSLWVRGVDAACGCPDLRTRRSYLLLGSNEASSKYSGLHADRDSLSVEWREDWAWRMRKFQRRQRNGRCRS